MSKIFMVHDIANLETTVSKRKFHNSAMACATLTAVASTVGYETFSIDAMDRIDYWCEYILKLDTDLSQDDLGSIFREAAQYFNKQADNLKDESSETEVYR